jgi:spore maturation protein CgeB
MKVVLFCHSILSDWNNGNAHFQRGVVAELVRRGHSVSVFEPRDAWSAENLVVDAGEQALRAFWDFYPGFEHHRYELARLDLEEALDAADVVIVHEWNAIELARRIGEHRARHGRYRLFFHDTHHRTLTAPAEMSSYDFSHYDGVLAFGEVLRERYAERGWGSRAWTWHEAADQHVFHPRPNVEPSSDVVWIGNWGDEERTGELSEFLLRPARDLGLSGQVHGVRYPEPARAALASAGLKYRGWLPNYRVPEAFAAARVTVHVPRRPYAQALPGIPTIRPFEAMASGIPLVSAPWSDTEGLFSAGRDFLMARNQAEMTRLLSDVLNDRGLHRALAESGLKTIRARHTCAHRVDELLDICRRVGLGTAPPPHRKHEPSWAMCK